MNIKQALTAEDRLTTQYQDRLSTLADKLLATAVPKLKLRGPLQILFGNGSEFIEYRGCQVWLDDVRCGIDGEGAVLRYSACQNVPDDAYDEHGEHLNELIISELTPLAKVLSVAIQVCHGYSDGCPKDIHKNP